MDVSAKDVWEALKVVCGATPDKTKIVCLVQVKEEDVKKAFHYLKSKE